MRSEVLISTIAASEVRPFRRTTPPHLHDDLEQEARIGVWNALQRLDTGCTPSQQRAWLGKAARSKVISFLRYTQVRRREVPAGDVFRYGEETDFDSACPTRGLLLQTVDAHRQKGETFRPDAEVEALDLARRIDQAVGMMLAGLTPEARSVIEARLHPAISPPQVPRRRRDDYVRAACDRLAQCARLAGVDVDLRPMISCR